jgi:hypothetical protein
MGSADGCAGLALQTVGWAGERLDLQVS